MENELKINRDGLFAYFDQMSEADGQIVTTADWLADTGMLIATEVRKETAEQIRVLTEALEKIHGLDYRGPRHISADIARKALRQALKGE
jgi:hypothetical protein